MTKRILITGSRNWTDTDTVFQALVEHTSNAEEDCVVMEGGCPTGVDLMAHMWCVANMVEVEIYPANWDKHGKAAGPIRNQQMVDTKPDVVLAFPLGESRGTRHCMSAAHKAGLRVIVYGETQEDAV